MPGRREPHAGGEKEQMNRRDEDSIPRPSTRRSSELEQFSELLLSVYRAAREMPLAQFQDAALELVKPALPFDACRWATGTASPASLVFHSAHFHQDPPGNIDDYEAVKEQDTVAFAVLANMGATVNFHAPTLYRGRSKSGIRGYARRYRHENGLVTASQLPHKGVWHAISLYRADADRQYAERERRLCQCLVPHLMEALSANRLRHAAGLNGDVEGPRWHLAIADGTGALYHLEPDFAELLRSEWSGWQDGLLPQPLREAMLKGNPPRYAGRALIVTRKIEKDLLFLRARRRLPVDDLTAREVEVAKHVAQGLSHKQIAARLSIAPATVRNHIQAIHARLQVRNNAELAAQLKMAGL
jgi:DNA-binding CsgD family transcriptional regulator